MTLGVVQNDNLVPLEIGLPARSLALMTQVMSMYEKRHPRYPLSIEQGTAAVPDDGQYHVVVNNQIVLSTRVLELAKITFDEQREELRIAAGHPDLREILRKESGMRDVSALRSESSTVQSKKNRRGGPGGRGGVA
jgi:hypothetical protein